jgi:membrane protein implicated in regulation of membrane protease activity
MQKIGLFLLAAGAAVIVGYWIYGFIEWVAPLLPWPLKAAIVAFLLGGIVIVASLIRERVKKSKEEERKFKGVDQ